MKIDFELSNALEGKYEVVGTTSPLLHSRIGLVDFRTITEAQVQALIKAGTSYLKAIPVKKKPVV